MSCCRVVWISAVVIIGALAMGPAHAQDLAQIWRVGDQLGPWRVQAVLEHPEFRRWTLASQGATTVLEVVADPKRADRTWCGTSLCLQPGPGAKAPEDLLRVALAELRRRDARPTAAPLLTAGADRAPDLDIQGVGLAALNLAVWLGALALAAWTWRSGRQTGEGRAVHDLALVAWVLIGPPLALLAVSAIGVPAAWVTVLHEGGTAQNISVALGHYGHCGPNLRWLASLPVLGRPMSATDLVALNLSLSLLDVLGLALLVGRAVGLWGALALAALLALDPVAQLAAVSESEAAAVTALLLLSWPALATLARPGPVRDRRAAAAWLHLGLTGLALALTRTEAAGALIAAAVWHGCRAVKGDGWWSRLPAALRVWWTRAGVWRRGAVLVMLASTAALSNLPTRWGWLVQGLAPLQPSALALPLLAVACLGAGVVVLAGFGLGHVVRSHWLAWGWAPLSAVVLFRVWFAASHGVFLEMVRYAIILLPWIAVAAALGAGWLVRTLGAGRWPRLGVAAGVTAFAALTPPISQAGSLAWDGRVGALQQAPLLDTDQQAEVRFLLDALQRWPHCAFVTPIHLANERLGAKLETGHVLYGAGLSGTRQLPGSLTEALAVARQHNPQCVHLLQGLDCNLLVGPGCPGPGAAWQVLAHVRRAQSTWSDPAEYGKLAEIIDLFVLSDR